MTKSWKLVPSDGGFTFDDVNYLEQLGCTFNIVRPEFGFLHFPGIPVKKIVVRNGYVSIFTNSEEQEIMIKLRYHNITIEYEIGYG